MPGGMTWHYEVMNKNLKDMTPALETLVLGGKLAPRTMRALWSRGLGFSPYEPGITDAGAVRIWECVQTYKISNPGRALALCHGLARTKGLRGLTDVEAARAARWIAAAAKVRTKS